MTDTRMPQPLLAIATSLAALAAVVGIVYRRVMYPPLPRPRRDRIRIAAVGDSNTYGAGMLFRRRRRRSYPGRLEQLLGEQHQVLNYGVNRRALQRDADLPYDATPFAAASVDADADTVLIMLGSNDARGDNWNAPRFESELIAFVDRYRSRGATVFLLTPPIAYANRLGVHWWIIEEEVSPIVRRVADALGVRLIDVFEITRLATSSHPDGIHLDARASAIVADAVAEALA
jgi:lysophospholipase L1-like esterase